MKSVKLLVFLPPCLLLVPAVALNFAAPHRFEQVLSAAYDAALSQFGWLAPLMALVMLALCAIAFVSPLGSVVIGGPEAKPLLKKWNLFAIVVCVNIGIGILFWGPIEPLNYLHEPPERLGIEPRSEEAQIFAITTVYLHNTLLPLSFATLVGMMFAFAYYNMGQPFTLGSPLAPLLGRAGGGAIGQLIDATCLYALVAAMSASLGAVLLLLGGGVHYYLNIPGDPPRSLLAGLGALSVIAYTVAAVTGLTKGIRILANIKTALFVLFLAFIFLLGPTRFIVTYAVQGLGQFVSHFFEKATYSITAGDDPWAHKWTQMYMSAWCAWAPLNGLFFGRIAYGYKVRTYLIFNLLLPAAFMGVWMAIISGAVVNLEIAEGGKLWALFKSPGGDKCVMYAFIEHYPLVRYITPAFLFVCFISFITVAAAVVSTMAGLCSTGVSPDSPEATPLLKIFWGVLVGVLAWIMVTYAGIDGIRMLSNLAGVPTLFLCAAVGIAAVAVMARPAKFDQSK